MRWVTASELEQWARSTTARDTLPEIVSDLILASSPDIAAIRFLSRDKGQVRGFDGVLVSDAAGLNVPQGKSYWEIGTDANYKAKAKADFEKRTREVSRAEQADITLVLVSPWTWDTSGPKNKLEDWLNARKASSSWKDVHYIDGSMLEIWLEQRPAVAAWHARRTLGVKPQEGVRSTDEYWQDFVGQFNPMLTEEVLDVSGMTLRTSSSRTSYSRRTSFRSWQIRRTKWWPSQSRRSARRRRVSVISSKLGPWSLTTQRPAASCSPTTTWFSCCATTPHARRRNSRRLERSLCPTVARRNLTGHQSWRGRVALA